MKNTIKFTIAAILSLCIGVGFATPLIVEEIIPYPRTPQGPTADFSVNVVYADFAVQESIGEIGESHVTYNAVINVTNLADISAKIGMLDFAAAEQIVMRQGPAAAHASVSGTNVNSGGSGGRPVQGLWLDNQWLNVTWIPGNRTDGMFNVMRLPWGSGDTIRYIASLPITAPNLPANASETGYFIEGIPVKVHFYYNATSKTTTFWDTMYANGTWINVTGRIRVENPETSVFERGVIAKQTTAFAPRVAENQSSTGSYQRITILCGGVGDFNSTFAPQQSRLIQVTGVIKSYHSGALDTGEISFYAATRNHIYEQPINGTFYDTTSHTNQFKTISLTMTANNVYNYNTVLGPNEVFVSDQWGVEVFIRPRS